MNEIILYEELSMNAHPAIKTEVYDGWLLRFANGYTNRANSVNMIYPSELNPIDKIGYCEEVYTSQGLASVFKITPLTVDMLDKPLEERGYKKITPTNLMIAPITEQYVVKGNVIVTDTFSNEWQQDYFRLNEISDEMKIKTDKIILANIQNKKLYASIIENGITVACGLCVIENRSDGTLNHSDGMLGGYAGLFDIVVDAKYRGKGLGYDLCVSLLNRAFDEGARNGYIQVVASNTPAIALYSKLGYVDCYQYWYRVKGDYRTM